MKRLFLLLLLSACSGQALRAGGDPDYQMFLRADTDGSGKLSAVEAAALLAPKVRFEDFDADGDGLLAWNELRQAVSLREQPRPRYEPPESRLESR